jgi:hypothetical protein
VDEEDIEKKLMKKSKLGGNSKKEPCPIAVQVKEIAKENSKTTGVSQQSMKKPSK